MVKKVPNQSEDKMRKEFSALDYLNSKNIDQPNSAINYPFWCCAVNEKPGAIGYWIGELPNFYAYLVVQPIILGDESAIEVIRAWVDPDCRGKGKGMFPSLLNCVASTCSLLVGDREGMTERAFEVWNNVSGFTVRYFDFEEKVFVSEDKIPKQDKFTKWSNGERWLITLTIIT